MARSRNNWRSITQPEFKITLLRALAIIIMGIIVMRMFYLQIVRHDFYQAVAAKAHYGYTELPARRGEIFIKDYASGEDVGVATNITLDTLFADPTLIENKKIVVDRIVPLIFNLEDERAADTQRIETATKRAQTQEDLDKIKPFTDEELYTNFYNKILQEITQETRPIILLSNTLEQPALDAIQKLSLPGIEIKETNLYAYPQQISGCGEKNKVCQTAIALTKYLDIPPTQLDKILIGKNRYVILSKKVRPEVASEITKIIEEDTSKNFFGLGLIEEYYRFYPEGELAANVLGYVTSGGLGSYGIESTFNNQLQGKKGVFQTQRDGNSRQITVGESVIEPAVDGNNITLTIDRSIQMTVEKMLAKAVTDYRADSGQVIVMDPKTGKIMAMAHFPSFDPNQYSKALETVEINLTSNEVAQLIPIEEEEDAFWFYRNVIAHDRYKVMRVQIESEKEEEEGVRYIYKRYKNWIGLEAYQNKAVSAPYEPGSVFKAITMASAIDDHDVTPKTGFYDNGVLEVDEFQIKNVSGQCTGYVTMTNILEFSCNTGIGWVAQKIGRNLFSNYMKKFGFGQRTGIEFDNEHPGLIKHWDSWADSELATHAFGQGFTTTPLQMATAYSVIANGGTLMQPHIIEKTVSKGGTVTETHPVAIQRVISEETAKTITAMLVSAVENGVAANAQVPKHFIAAKTGTSQTYRHGKPLTGAGTTITTIAGFGPIDTPRFVLYVKFDRPRSSEWADSTAAYLYRDIATYLYEYLGIPPDKN